MEFSDLKLPLIKMFYKGPYGALKPFLRYPLRAGYILFY